MCECVCVVLAEKGILKMFWKKWSECESCTKSPTWRPHIDVIATLLEVFGKSICCASRKVVSEIIM